jgi:phenylalanyl-tRNA synthetase beta chain
LNKKFKITHRDVPRFPAVQRDLAIVVDNSMVYEQVEKATAAAKVSKLSSVNLFDVFESDKLGVGKKSMAISFTFLDEEKTLTDKEIDAMISKIIASYEKELGAEVRK